MNIHDLREAQARFENNLDSIVGSRESLYQLRKAFTKYFTLNRIRNMNIDDYVIGVSRPEDGKRFNFCYGIERQLDGLGRIIGATSFKFGVYFGRTKSDGHNEYRHSRKFGDNHYVAFENVRNSILQLLDAGKIGDITSIVGNPLSPMFKGKILCTFYPDKYLNVFADAHLDYFLTQLDLDSAYLIKCNAVYKREALIEFKNRDKVMKTWSADLFSHFLYSEYPGRPPKTGVENESTDPLNDYRSPVFPPNQSPSFIDLSMLTPSDSVSTKSKGKSKGGKIDYEKEAKKLKKLGDRGEKIVMDLEKIRLKEAGRNDLANKVKRVSLKSDSYGYDILSFETNGTERHIEVKATILKVGNANFFLSANELLTASEDVNFFIYVVYDIKSIAPQVWAIKNPFNPENDKVVKVPMNYKVSINARVL